VFHVTGVQTCALPILAATLQERFPGLRVVGTHSPPFRPLTAAEDEAICAEIEAAQPDLVWVGLSTPKQERWMAAHRERLSAPVQIGRASWRKEWSSPC